MGAKVGAIILLIIGLGLIVYLVNSGGLAKLGEIATPPGSASGTTPAATTSTAATSTNPFFTFLSEIFRPGPFVAPPVVTPGGGSGSGQSSSGGGAAATGTVLGPAPSSTASSSDLSPYYHQVRFSPSTYTITIYTTGLYNNSSTVDITGWEVKTNRGGEYIPQAVNFYDASGLEPAGDIILTLNQNDYVYLYSTSAPVNLRINACSGYLYQTHMFNPALPMNCPAVNRSQISGFTGQCQNYILTLSGNCQAPNMSSPQIPRSDYACQQYLLNNFTYASCIQNHKTDPNFLRNQWNVYMGSNPLDKYHDTVELLDRNGLVVDSYTY